MTQIQKKNVCTPSQNSGGNLPSLIHGPVPAVSQRATPARSGASPVYRPSSVTTQLKSAGAPAVYRPNANTSQQKPGTPSAPLGFGASPGYRPLAATLQLQPVAGPPVYRPITQASQQKAASSATATRSSAPPVYRPLATTSQLKAVAAPPVYRPAGGSGTRVGAQANSAAGAPVYRPQDSFTLQGKGTATPFPTLIAPRVYRPQAMAPGAASVQMSKKDDKYKRQNTKAASATKSISTQNQQGQEQITLDDIFSEKVAKKLSGFSSKSSKELQSSTAILPAQINLINATITAEIQQDQQNQPAAFATLTAAQKEAYIQTFYGRLLEELGTIQLREPHVNDAGGLGANVDMDVTIYQSNNNDPLKWVWWYYAKYTPSSGWEKMTKKTRQHTPQFAELGTGGFFSRLIYDWYNNRFFFTPHYNTVEEKALDNAYIHAVGAETWTITGVMQKM